MRWSAHADRNATADYTAHHAGGTTTVTYNQQTDGGAWKPFGVYDIETAENHPVVLADTGAGDTINGIDASLVAGDATCAGFA